MEKNQHFQIKETGIVKGVKKNLAKIEGLPTCMSGQIVEFQSGTKGLITGFNQQAVYVLILGDEAEIRADEPVYSRMETFKIPVGEGFLGRVVNSLGEACDGLGLITTSIFQPIFKEAPSNTERGKIKEQLLTGIKAIDTIVPVAKGQKQLIMGDRITGKTSIATTAILNQKGKDVICVYCCIGKSLFDAGRTIQLLEESGALNYTIVLLAGAQASVGEQYLAPYAAASVGEYFMRQGKDVLVVFDDLTNHAWAYREISLLMERPPGREAYPGDIFYIHAQLLERAGKLNSGLGGGSMTFLPIVETLEGDVTGYIPSNLISITDGQIYLSSQLFNEGFKPAVDFNLSISTVGNQAQKYSLKKLSANLRFEYTQYRRILPLARLKTAFSKTAEFKIKRGQVITELLIQHKNMPVSEEEMMIVLYAFSTSILDDLPMEEVRRFKDKIFHFITESNSALMDKLKKEQKLSVETARKLDEYCRKFFAG
ncbi:MAG: F0F1 ATP synthase subunit alpha [Candidatus Omnitrophota bacterium]